MTGSNYIYTITLDAGQASAGLSSMQGKMQAATRSAGGLREAIDKVGRAAFAFVNISDSIDRMVSSIDNLSAPGLKLNQQMHDLSAITGVTGAGLKQIEDYARQSAKTFGGEAADSVEAYKLVLSQLGPEIAQVPEALAAMGDSIKTTSKLMGNDTAAAAEVLTTALNQYQVSLDDPIKASEEMARMMNVMAAAGQAGSAELPTIKEALKQAGMMAKTAGVSFEETNAAIQMLDKAGKKGSEGGVALRNVLSTLSQGRFLPKDVQDELTAAGVSIDTLTDKSLSLTDRLRGLSPVMNDQALISKLFGRENAAAAIALMAAIDPIDELTAAISGSNSAYEQAGVIMQSDVEKMSRFQAKIDDVKISLYNIYSGVLPQIKAMGSVMQTVSGIAVGVNAMHALSETALGMAIKSRTSEMWKSVTAAYTAGGSLGIFSAAAAVAKMACHGLAAGFRAIWMALRANPFLLWTSIIGGLIKLVKTLYDKFEGVRKFFHGIKSVVKGVWNGDGKTMKERWDRGKKEGAESWKKDHPDKPAIADATVPKIAEPSEIQAATAGKTGSKKSKKSKSKKSKTSPIDLNNIKGSTDYAAVAAKLQPKAFTGLGGGKVGSPVSMPAASKPAAGDTASAMPELPSFMNQPEDKTVSILQRIADDTRRIAASLAVAASASMPLAAQQVIPVSPAPAELSRPAPLAIAPVERQEARGNGGKTVQFAKFCDRVEITVPAGTTSSQVDAILNELMRRINDAVE